MSGLKLRLATDADLPAMREVMWLAIEELQKPFPSLPRSPPVTR